MAVSRTQNNFLVSNGVAVISIDNSDIFTIQGIHFSRIEDNATIRTERLDNENFHLPWNKTYSLSIDLFKAMFPHEHHYSEAIQNELISVWKWLKIIHGKKKKPFTINSPLPSDLLIHVSVLIFD